MKRPFALLAISFCLGITAASVIKLSFWPLFISAGTLLCIGLVTRKSALCSLAFILCAVFSCGAVSLINYVSIPKSHILRYVCAGGPRIYTVKGSINSQPLFEYGKSSFLLKTEEVQCGNLKYKCCGRILVHINGRNDFHYLDDLILTGNLYKPFRDSLAKSRSYADYLNNLGIFLIMRVKSGASIVRANRNINFSITGFILRLKERIEDSITRYTSYVTAAILKAMILGEQREIPAHIYSSMVSTGTVHILVVSGSNVGIIAFVVVLLLRSVRFPRKLRLYFSLPILAAYCLMTGSSNPVVRATIMATFFILGSLSKREADIYNSLGLAAVFILAFNPLQLFDIGFQLSFVSVFSIVYLYPKIKSFFRVEQIKINSLRRLAEGCIVSLSAWLGTMGFIAYYFRIFSPVTVLANVLVVPLASLITLCGLAFLFMSLIYPPFAPVLASNCELLTSVLVRVNDALIQIPGATLRL